MIILKSGDTFSPEITVTEDNGNAVDISGWVITSSIVGKVKRKRHVLEVISRIDILGKFTLGTFNTQDVNVGNYEWDIKISVNGQITHTETEQIKVIDSVTS